VKGNARILIPLLFCAFVLWVLCCSGPCTDIVANNIRLNEYQDLLRSVEHPADTRLLRKEKAVGILVGCGNHCDFFVAELREFDSSWEEVQSQYATELISEKDLVRVVLLDDRKLYTAQVPHRLNSRKEWGVGPTKTNVYLVYIFVSDVANRDIRCH
jgi:hypothetical protein